MGENKFPVDKRFSRSVTRWIINYRWAGEMRKKKISKHHPALVSHNWKRWFIDTAIRESPDRLDILSSQLSKTVANQSERASKTSAPRSFLFFCRPFSRRPLLEVGVRSAPATDPFVVVRLRGPLTRLIEHQSRIVFRTLFEYSISKIFDIIFWIIFKSISFLKKKKKKLF